MDIKIFSNSFLEDLRRESGLSLRKRKNHNLHFDYVDSCQRLFNAIEMDSYIRPHRHSLDPKHECLLALSGLFCLYIFDDTGKILRVTKFGSDLYRITDKNCAAGVEIPPNCWHTVVALSQSAILFEVKAGPFIPSYAKEFASWAPEEGASNSLDYLKSLRRFSQD